MTIFIMSLWLILTVTYVIVPVAAYQKKSSKRKLEEDYRHFQVYTLKKYCQPLQHLSYEEIREKYNVTGTYNKIGKRFQERS